MNIAICDDDIHAIGLMERLVDTAFAGRKESYSCKTFLSGDRLLEYLDGSLPEFQIYLLDIEMSGTDGLEAATQIRKRDSDAIIIFITSHTELMPAAFRVLAFQYIIKPVHEEKTIGILLSALHWLEQRKSVYQYIVNKQSQTLNLSQIEYIESIGRKVSIHTVDGETREYYGTLKEAAKKVEGLLFARPHNSYIVNLDHSRRLRSDMITMNGGAEIPISAKYHASFHNAYRDFVLLRSRDC